MWIIRRTVAIRCGTSLKVVDKSYVNNYTPCVGVTSSIDSLLSLLNIVVFPELSVGDDKGEGRPVVVRLLLMD